MPKVVLYKLDTNSNCLTQIAQYYSLTVHHCQCLVVSALYDNKL